MRIAHSHLLLDACCILNFCASHHFLAILQTIPARVVVTEVVRSKELLTLQKLADENSEGANQFEEAIQQELLSITDFASEEEAERFINYVFSLGDNGESATGAIAVSRNWAIATDDKKAISFFQREAPRIQILTTPEIIKYWSETTDLDERTLGEALFSIQTVGRYSPPRNHPLRGWWEEKIIR